MHFPQCEIVTQPMIALAACWHCFLATTVNRYILMALTVFAANINTAIVIGQHIRIMQVIKNAMNVKICPIKLMYTCILKPS